MARTLFADHGFDVTTTRQVAEAAGVSVPALYRYFDAKLAIYLGVYDDALAVLTARLVDPLAALPTFAEQFVHVLEQSHALNAEVPSLAAFLGSARIDAGRNPEIAAALRQRRDPARSIVATLVATGRATGEIAPERTEEVTAFLRTVLVGLVTAVSGDQRTHRAAADAFVHLVRGGPFSAPRAAQ